MKRILPILVFSCLLDFAAQAQLRFSWTTTETPTLITVEVFAENVGGAPEWLLGANLNLHYNSASATAFPGSFVIDPVAGSMGCPIPMCIPPVAGPGLSASGQQVLDGSWTFDSQSFNKRFVVALSSNFSTSTGLEIPPTNFENPPVKLGDIFLSVVGGGGGYGSFQGAMGVNEAWTYTASTTIGATGGNPTGPCAAGVVPTCWIVVQDPETQPFSGVLPVELIGFEANKYLTSSSRLVWQTATEDNTSHFEIERSKDRTNWQMISKVVAVGNASGTQSYSFVDKDVYDGRASREIFYYRLNIVDRDGSGSYSNIENVRFANAQSQFSVYAFPNPSTDHLIVELNHGEDGKTPETIELVNTLGQLVYSQRIDEGAEAVYLLHSNTNVQAGSYVLRIIGTDNELLAQDKIVVQR